MLCGEDTENSALLQDAFKLYCKLVLLLNGQVCSNFLFKTVLAVGPLGDSPAVCSCDAKYVTEKKYIM